MGFDPGNEREVSALLCLSVIIAPVKLRTLVNNSKTKLKKKKKKKTPYQAARPRRPNHPSP